MRPKITPVVALLLCTPAIAQDNDTEPPGREHSIPLFMADGDPDQRQGFIRIINHSDQPGTVEIAGIDDAGTRHGPIELSIGARQTKHINSEDVENGNESKGLSEGFGNGEGDWRLLLNGGGLDIEPLAYVRTGLGFLTSMHGTVPGALRRHRVPIFNPGSNSNQASSLRLVNPGDVEANVTITGRDDAAAGDGGADGPGGDYRLAIPAGGAQTVSSAELEAGNADSDGLGNGTGKWSLDLTSDAPIVVVNLMSTVSGHLTNLSGANPDYRGAVGLWQVAFDDDPDAEGYIALLPDSRMYAWLPELGGVNRIARGTFESTPDGLAGEGELFESGKIDVVGIVVSGGAEGFEFSAQYRSGDWIQGQYTPEGGSARSFRGWAFTGFERGSATEDAAGLWTPVDEDGDLTSDFEPDADGAVGFSFTAGSFTCTVTGDLGPINPAFIVYEADVTIRCAIIVIPPENVDLIMAVMDARGAPGTGTRSLVLAIVHDDRKIALGGLFDLEP